MSHSILSCGQTPRSSFLDYAEERLAQLLRLGGAGCGGLERECPRLAPEVREAVRSAYQNEAARGEVDMHGIARRFNVHYSTVARWTPDLRGVTRAPRKPYVRVSDRFA